MKESVPNASGSVAPAAKGDGRSEVDPGLADKGVAGFLQHLAADRGASTYTQRNYRQALVEFHRWHRTERRYSRCWETLQRDDFRAYLRFLGRGNLSRAAIQL